jgi:hypothetical protein
MITFSRYLLPLSHSGAGREGTCGAAFALDR